MAERDFEVTRPTRAGVSEATPIAQDGADELSAGYGRPPVRTRFKPGRSGNPTGRPRGSRNKSPAREVDRMRDLIMQEAYREIPVMDAGRAITVTMMEASLRSLAAKSAKGDVRSQQLLFRLVQETEKQRAENLITFLRGALRYREEAYAEIERSEAAGEGRREICPHPDDIYVDADHGTVDIVGPSSWEEKEAWDQIDQILLQENRLTKEIEELASRLEEARTGEKAEKLRKRFDVLQKAKRSFEATTAPMSTLNKVRRLRRLAALARAGGGLGRGGVVGACAICPDR